MNKKSNKQKILLVEDDVNLGFLLVEYFESNGFDVKLYIDGEAGLKGFQLGYFDICIVDIMLPKLDGFSLVKEMKILNSEIPIIILSARSLKEDKIQGFEFGVDDYITKPFDEEELLCRIKAVLNRRNPHPSNSERTLINQKKLGAYEFDAEKQELVLGKITQRLTYKESKILKQLAQSKNNLVKREEIMIEVWGESDYFTSRSLDVFISKLRSYLKLDPRLCIKTIPTVGYILEESKL
ncbi:MAG: response regulator transcription factor [Bacteroidales bacterium]|nr:response regulator transcription factor [Bacteroidales bacterium]